MEQVLAWFKSWWGVSQVSRQIAALRQRVGELAAAKGLSDNAVEAHLQDLAVMRADMLRRLENVESELERSRSLNKKLQASLETTLEALEAKEKIVIPGLVAANQVLVSRWEAETAVLTLRQAAASAERSG